MLLAVGAQETEMEKRETLHVCMAVFSRICFHQQRS